MRGDFFYQMMKAVYIHGFAGSIHSDVVGNLRKYCPWLEWCPLEVDHHVDASVGKINAFLREHADVAYLIGSSLGGFYVLCADFNGEKIVVNPVLNPMSTLKKSVGTHAYRGRREDGARDFKFTMQDLFAFKRWKPQDTPQTLCHYTAHDQVLGEEVKREYPKFFLHAEMCPDLQNHFMNEHYIKHALAPLLAKKE